MLKKIEQVQFWMVAVVRYFKVLAWHLHTQNEENYKSCQHSQYPDGDLKFCSITTT